eukprot:scaffold7977_cov128-Isochrysis_galbana.AAC.1
MPTNKPWPTYMYVEPWRVCPNGVCNCIIEVVQACAQSLLKISELAAAAAAARAHAHMGAHTAKVPRGLTPGLTAVR